VGERSKTLPNRKRIIIKIKEESGGMGIWGTSIRIKKEKKNP
jgi:hypothetical protein